jgi:hypothetical protein
MNPMFCNGLCYILLYFFPYRHIFVHGSSVTSMSHNQVTSRIHEIPESSSLNPTFLSALKFLAFYLHCWYEFDHVVLQTNCITNVLSYPTNVAVTVQFIWTNMKSYIAENTTTTINKLLTLSNRWVGCVKDSEKLLRNIASARSRDCVWKTFLVKCTEYDLADPCWRMLR